MYRAGQQVSGGRCHHDQVGLLAEPDMRHLGNVGEDAGVHRLPGKRLECGGPDKAQRGFGGDDADLMARLGELTDDGACLVRGDPPGDADDDPLAIHLRRPFFVEEALHDDHSRPAPSCYSPSVCSSRSAWISRIAIESGFSCSPGSTSGPTYSRMPSPSWL